MLKLRMCRRICSLAEAIENENLEAPLLWFLLFSASSCGGIESESTLKTGSSLEARSFLDLSWLGLRLASLNMGDLFWVDTRHCWRLETHQLILLEQRPSFEWNDIPLT